LYTLCIGLDLVLQDTSTLLLARTYRVSRWWFRCLSTRRCLEWIYRAVQLPAVFLGAEVWMYIAHSNDERPRSVSKCSWLCFACKSEHHVVQRTNRRFERRFSHRYVAMARSSRQSGYRPSRLVLALPATEETSSARANGAGITFPSRFFSTSSVITLRPDIQFLQSVHEVLIASLHLLQDELG
jgi:hypothetical protein